MFCGEIDYLGGKDAIFGFIFARFSDGLTTRRTGFSPRYLPVNWDETGFRFLIRSKR